MYAVPLVHRIYFKNVKCYSIMEYYWSIMWSYVIAYSENPNNLLKENCYKVET
jgi:hypothetical protein